VEGAKASDATGRSPDYVRATRRCRSTVYPVMCGSSAAAACCVLPPPLLRQQLLLIKENALVAEAVEQVGDGAGCSFVGLDEHHLVLGPLSRKQAEVER
jgi:hypothetical protein